MMKKFLKLQRRIISFAVCFALVFSSLSVFAADLFIDFEESGLEKFTYSQGSGVEIITSGSNKYMSISPNVDGISAVAGINFTPQAGKTIEISYDIIINSILNDDTVVASITEGADQFLKLGIKDNALVCRNSSGVDIVISNNLLVNKWYTLKFLIDFDNNSYDFYIGEECVLANQSGLSSYSYAGKEAKLSMSSKYSPGFSVDNFRIGNTVATNSVKIDGPTVVSLAEGNGTVLEYIFSAYDTEGNILEDASFSYMLRGDSSITGVFEGNKLTVTVADTTPAGTFDVYGIAGSAVFVKTVYVERYVPELAYIEILGDGKIVYGYNENTYPFKIKGTDTLGSEIDPGDAYFSFVGDAPEELQLDPHTGTITVTGELPKDYHLEIQAELYSNGMTATKSLVLMDAATYRSDNERFQVVVNHIENIYKYAADTWNGTPLLAQAIDRLSLTPALWWETPELSHIPSNQAALSQFQRACDVMYMLTGEEKYRDRIDESNKFFSENYVNSNGLPYWGGHVYIDLETGKENRDPVMTKNCHELKGHDPYMESFLRVNPTMAENLVIASFVQHIKDWETMDLSRHGNYDVATDPSLFYNNTETYTPSNKGFSPTYSTNLGFSSTLYGFARLATDMYRYSQDEHYANAFMRIFDAFWRVASPDPDYWLEVAQNTTAGRKGYPDEAVQGVKEITVGPVNPVTGEHQWWLLDPVPSFLQSTGYGDRYWRARGEDLIDQGYITEENQWAARECYFLDSCQPNAYPLYWDFIDAVGKDHPYADIVAERAIRHMANYMRLAYDPANNNFKMMLIDGTDLTGFVCKRAGYYGGIGQVYNRGSGGTRTFASAALTYARAKDYPQFKEQRDMIWTYLKKYAEANEMGNLGDLEAGDGGTDVNLTCSKNSEDYILGLIYLYEATDNVQFLDLARVIAKNHLDTYLVDGFIVEKPEIGYIYTGGRQSNGMFIHTLLEAAIRGDFDKTSMYVDHSGFYESYLFIEHLGEQRNSGNEYVAWEIPMPSDMVKGIELKEKEIELKVGEIKTVEFTIYPDDAANKGVYIASSDTSCVTVNLDSRSIQAIKPGTVEVLVRSTADIMVKDKIKVTVVE